MQIMSQFNDVQDVQDDRFHLVRKCMKTGARIASIDATNLAEGASRNNHLKARPDATNRQLICAARRAIPAHWAAGTFCPRPPIGNRHEIP